MIVRDRAPECVTTRASCYLWYRSYQRELESGNLAIFLFQLHICKRVTTENKNTYISDLGIATYCDDAVIFYKPFQCVDRLYTSESDVCRRQIMTYEDGPRTERI